MSHMDEKIIAMINGIEPSDYSVETSVGKQEEMPDVRQPIVRIGTEMVPFMKQRLLEDKIAVYMPKSFKLMTPSAAAIKYPSERRPGLIFTNDIGTINLAFNYTVNPLDESDIEPFRDAMVEMLKRMQPVLQWYEDGIKEIDGRSIGYCEFLTPAMNVNLYNLMFFVSLEDRALLCTFNCIEDEMVDWKKIAINIMDTFEWNGFDKDLLLNPSENGG
ncbi:MAG: hypothetical protein ACE3L7_30550 [Candidatus Pristimantibacillus sp.]